MRFQTHYDGFTITVESKDGIYDHRGVRRGVSPGLHAEFKGRLHIFDSDEAARGKRWTKEQKEQVEKFLLSSPHFGSDFTLAFDQESPKELEEWMADEGIQLNKNFFRACRKIWEEDDDVKQCPNKAVPGKDYCGDHLPKTVTTGMGTTKAA